MTHFLHFLLLPRKIYSSLFLFLCFDCITNSESSTDKRQVFYPISSSICHSRKPKLSSMQIAIRRPAKQYFQRLRTMGQSVFLQMEFNSFMRVLAMTDVVYKIRHAITAISFLFCFAILCFNIYFVNNCEPSVLFFIPPKTLSIVNLKTDTVPPSCVYSG